MVGSRTDGKEPPVATQKQIEGQSPQRPQEHRTEDGSRQGRVGGQRAQPRADRRRRRAAAGRERGCVRGACSGTCSPTSTRRTRCRRCWRGASSNCSGASTAPPGSRPSSSSTASLPRSATGCARRGRSGAHRAAIERVYGDKDGKCPEALTKALDERDRATDERRREILAVDMEIVLGAPSAHDPGGARGERQGVRPPGALRGDRCSARSTARWRSSAA